VLVVVVSVDFLGLPLGIVSLLLKKMINPKKSNFQTTTPAQSFVRSNRDVVEAPR